MTLQLLLHHPIVQALGWSLLHFLWQGALLAAVLAAANALTRSSSARLRYAIGCLVMLLMPVALFATLSRIYPTGTSSVPAATTVRIAAAIENGATPMPPDQ